jgi:hypothetical protein
MTSRARHDDPVTIDAGKPLRLSAEAIRALKKATGRTMTDLLQDEDDDANRFQVMAFAELHRRYAAAGHLPDAGELWERSGSVELEITAPEQLDPTPGATSITSAPLSVTGD